MTGFTFFDEKPVSVLPTLPEILAALSAQEKVAVLNGFANKILPRLLRTDYGVRIPIAAIRSLYQAIDNIEEKARAYMRGEVMITPAVVDPETGEETSPAVYNNPPATATALKNLMIAEFSELFTETQVMAVLNKMVAYSKYNGSGDWAFYQSQIIL